MDHGEVVGRTLLVARGNAPERFEPVDQARNEVAASVRGAVEVGLSALVALARGSGHYPIGANFRAVHRIVLRRTDIAAVGEVARLESVRE